MEDQKLFFHSIWRASQLLHFPCTPLIPYCKVQTQQSVFIRCFGCSVKLHRGPIFKWQSDNACPRDITEGKKKKINCSMRREQDLLRLSLRESTLVSHRFVMTEISSPRWRIAQVLKNDLTLSELSCVWLLGTQTGRSQEQPVWSQPNCFCSLLSLTHSKKDSWHFFKCKDGQADGHGISLEGWKPTFSWIRSLGSGYNRDNVHLGFCNSELSCYA